MLLAVSESLWHSSLASQEELCDVISLLSCRPNQPLQLHQPSQHVPGTVFFTYVHRL